MGLAPKIIPHLEHWSCPDAETYFTGIDYYQHPRLCRLKMFEVYPQLGLPVPEKDESVPRPDLTADVSEDKEGGHHVRCGADKTEHWDLGKKFRTAEDVFAFSPLEQADFTHIPVVESQDYSN